MKVATPLILLLLVALSEALPASQLPPGVLEEWEKEDDAGGMDEEDEKTLDEFEKDEHQEIIEGPEAHKKREESFEEAKAQEEEQNDEFLRGDGEFFEKFNQYSDLTDKEFKDERTGVLESPQERSMGLLDDGAVDEEAEAYYDRYRNDRSEPPASYSAVDKKWVTDGDVRDQRKCGSCAAFAALSVIEVVFAKQTKRIGDFSEQELIDCGFAEAKVYGVNVNGCKGASLQAYMVYAHDSHIPLTAEVDYPYKGDVGKCPPKTSLNPYNIGADVSSPHWIKNKEPDEETMKKIVYQMGAVSAGVYASDKAFQNYAGGIFDGCHTNDPFNHAVAVIGYGTTDEGEDFWLIKNSWGKGWGEKGFMRLKRGVGMCGIGTSWATIESKPTPGPYDPERTTEVPCVDKWSNCPKLAETNCFDNAGNCPKSCGMCPGMTKHDSYTCFDRFTNCKYLADTKMQCYQPQIGGYCKISCGLCPGLKRHPSNDPPAPDPCFKSYGNCDSYKNYCFIDSFKKACPGTCLKECQ